MNGNVVASGHRPYEPPNPTKVGSRASAVVRGAPEPLPPARFLGETRFSGHLLRSTDSCLAMQESDRIPSCAEFRQRLQAPPRSGPGHASQPPVRGVRRIRPHPKRASRSCQSSSRGDSDSSCSLWQSAPVSEAARSRSSCRWQWRIGLFARVLRCWCLRLLGAARAFCWPTCSRSG